MPPPSKSSVPPSKKGIFTDAGETTWYSSDAKPLPEWHVKWQKAQATAEGGSPMFGKMFNVTGEILQTKDTKTFRADRAVAVSSDVLTLTGSVVVHSPKSAATLNCDKLVYDGKKKVFDATGDVSLKTNTVKITGVPEVKADSDFTQVSSPDMFKEKNAKGP
jgi:lipopolysaccharide assembly outer membrane protein LptD (OstA)